MNCNTRPVNFVLAQFRMELLPQHHPSGESSIYLGLCLRHIAHAGAYSKDNPMKLYVLSALGQQMLRHKIFPKLTGYYDKQSEDAKILKHRVLRSPPLLIQKLF